MQSASARSIERKGCADRNRKLAVEYYELLRLSWRRIRSTTGKYRAGLPGLRYLQVHALRRRETRRNPSASARTARTNRFGARMTSRASIGSRLAGIDALLAALGMRELPVRCCPNSTRGRGTRVRYAEVMARCLGAPAYRHSSFMASPPAWGRDLGWGAISGSKLSPLKNPPSLP